MRTCAILGGKRDNKCGEGGGAAGARSPYLRLSPQSPKGEGVRSKEPAVGTLFAED